MESFGKKESNWKIGRAVRRRNLSTPSARKERYVGHAAACGMIAGLIALTFPYEGAFFFEYWSAPQDKNFKPGFVHGYLRDLVDNDSAINLLLRVSLGVLIGAVIGLIINLRYEKELRRR